MICREFSQVDLPWIAMSGQLGIKSALNRWKSTEKNVVRKINFLKLFCIYLIPLEKTKLFPFALKIEDRLMLCSRPDHSKLCFKNCYSYLDKRLFLSFVANLVGL